jgi:hypothetical protein
MSGKRSLPSIWASRGAIVAAVTAVGLVLFAVVGAWMLFLPTGDAPATSRDVPTSESTTDPVGAVAVEDEPTQEPTRARKPLHHVQTVAPMPAPTPTAHPPAEDPTSTEAAPQPVAQDPAPQDPAPQDPAPAPAPAPDDTHPGNGHGNGNGNGNGPGNGHGPRA